MKTSTNKELKCWKNTFAPKNENILIADWLRENDMAVDADKTEGYVKFSDLRKYIVGQRGGRNIIDCEAMGEIMKDDYIDSFLRDILFDALDAIENNETREQNFFVPGMRYRCIKSVKGSFTKRKVYEQASEASDHYGWLTNNKGERHSWPQPSNIANQCETWGFAPEDIDPRVYFKSIA
ncbi:MAG: hypothetical protein IJ066_11665 [Bacteroidaceae bacterium]|nr:hypothetical protein [Bacteroidaceae bacterium]